MQAAPDWLPLHVQVSAARAAEETQAVAAAAQRLSDSVLSIRAHVQQHTFKQGEVDCGTHSGCAPAPDLDSFACNTDVAACHSPIHSGTKTAAVLHQDTAGDPRGCRSCSSC